MSLIRSILIDFDVKVADDLIANHILKDFDSMLSHNKATGLSPAVTHIYNASLQTHAQSWAKELCILLWAYENLAFRNKLLRGEGEKQQKLILFTLEQFMSNHCEGKNLDGTEYKTISSECKIVDPAEKYKRHTGWMIQTLRINYSTL